MHKIAKRLKELYHPLMKIHKNEMLEVLMNIDSPFLSFDELKTILAKDDILMFEDENYLYFIDRTGGFMIDYSYFKNIINKKGA